MIQHIKSSKKVLFFCLAGFVMACSSSTNEQLFDSSALQKADAEAIEKVVEQFILAEDSTVIEIPAGFFEFKTQLILDNKNDITIRGAGMTETVLSFKDLKAGGEGVKLVGNRIRIENLTVENAPGDGIKAQHSDDISFKKVNVTWTHGRKSENGTYAIYPVQCKNVLIEECVASHSKDAGIYVGQSENVIVRNSLAFGNVAGIEIENCDNAEVYGNVARDNAGGILIFNLPGLPKADGRGTKIYNNEILHNNHVNFAVPLNDEPNGNTVTMIPPGSGIVVLAGKDVEIYGNKIHQNKTAGIAIASYHITGFPMDAPNWSPFTYNVYIHNNDFERTWRIPDMSKEFGQLVTVHNATGIGRTQDIIYDGFWDKGLSPDIKTNPMKICIEEPQMEKLNFTLFDLWEGEENIKSSKDYSPFVCKSQISFNSISAFK